MLQTDDVPPAVYQLKVTSGPTLALAPMSLGSGAVGDPVPVGSTQSHLDINATPSTEVTVSYSQDGVMRWYTGADTSSNWFLAFCDDAGEYAGSAINADRASGVVSFNYGFSSSEHATFNNAITIQPAGQNVIFNQGGWIGQASGCNLMVQGAGPGNSAMMTFHCPSEFAGQFGLHGDARLHMGGWSWGTGAWYTMWSSADFANPACDYRFKDAVEPLNSTWETVKALKPIRYRQKEFALPIAEKISSGRGRRSRAVGLCRARTAGDAGRHGGALPEGRS